ncbi:MAG: isoprenylcysteine carboxylmethyltransferase family protein [Acidobacteriaceae bacterium]
MTRTTKTFLKMLIAGAVGAIIGGTLVAHHTASTVPTRLIFPRGMMLAIALICFFSIYWSAAAKDSAPTQSSESVWSRRLHLIVLNSAVLLLILPVPGLTRRFLPASRILTVAGLAIEIAGILFAFWARRHLGRNWSGEVRIATGHQLVRSGPYKTIRHPIYTGVLAMYAGVMLVSGQIHALLGFLIIAVAYWRKLCLEEKILSTNFGPDWDSWRRETWALVPPLF